jgi:NADP-dependent 3-hydroxy acid dehydrogenase YdfG
MLPAKETGMKPLQGKRAWITGASSGIGRATAEVLSDAGAEVVLSARRIDKLEALAKELRSRGGRPLVEPLDVTDKAASERIGKQLAAKGGVHILVNNAGIMPLSPMLDDRVDEWEETIDINIKGVLFAIRAVLPDMVRRRDGHIVNLSSVAGRFSYAGGAVYAATKFAVGAISDALRQEVLAEGVRVTTIEPGAVATELLDSIRDEKSKRAMTAKGGLFGPGVKVLEDVDIANAILYAVSQPAHVDVGEILIRPTVQAF